MITEYSTARALAEASGVSVNQAKVMLENVDRYNALFVDGVPFIDGRANAKRNKARKYNTVNREAK